MPRSRSDLSSEGLPQVRPLVESAGLQHPDRPPDARHDAEIANALVPFLADRLGVADLRLAADLVRVNDGWETSIYFFQLESSAPLPAEFDRPLALRIYSGAQNVLVATKEFTLESYVGKLGYPIATPLLCELDCAIMGGPFLILERIVGSTYYQLLVDRPWSVLYLPQRMGEGMARLHQLPCEGAPAPATPHLERSLEGMREVVFANHMDGLKPGLDWLCNRRPPSPAAPRILHLDFHPLNLIAGADAPLIVLDWSFADLGDPHADLGHALMMIECAPPPHPSFLQKAMVDVGRRLTAGNFLNAYRRRMPVDSGKLTYFRAWAAYHRLARYGGALLAGPKSIGVKHSLLRNARPEELDVASAYFRKWTGVAIQL